MGLALLLEYYNELPEPHGDDPKEWENQLQAAIERFKDKVAARYSEGTLQRLLQSSEAQTRRAALLALGLLGTMQHSNAAVAGMLHDEDRAVRHFACDALQTMWFRADTEPNNRELQRLMGTRERRKRRNGLDALIGKAPGFAEAYNQRAILHAELREWQKAIADCERVLKLNPFHFGAASGMGRCYMELGRHRAALKAFRYALRINPRLEEVEEKVRALESALGEEGKRDDKK